MKRNFTISDKPLEGIEAFLLVAKHRNFRRAASELRVTPSAMSQSIRKLEQRIGAALFIRTTRNVGLTEAGARLLEDAHPAYDQLSSALEAARGFGVRPTGLLRITCPKAVIPHVIAPKLASFCKAYPEIQLEIAASDERIDLAAGAFDAGIRLGQFISPDMTAVRLSKPFPLVVAGSRKYLKGKNVPLKPEDLREHACLAIKRPTGAIVNWQLKSGNRMQEIAVSGPIIAHDYDTLLAAARDGIGLIQVPYPIISADLADNLLTPLLQRFAPETPGVFLYYPGKRQILPKLRAFIDHLKAP